MSRSELADAVNAALDRLYPRRDLSAHYVDARWIGKLERGEHRWPSEERRAALRHALGATTDTELDLYSPRRTDTGPAWLDPQIRSLASSVSASDDVEVDRRSMLRVAATPALAELVAALVSFRRGGNVFTSSHVSDLQRLARQTDNVRRAYQDGRYSQALRALPPLLTTVVEQDLSPTPAVAAVSAALHQVASGLLLKVDDPALATVAADRSLVAAHRTGDPVQIASSARAVAHALTASGHPDAAIRFIESAAATLDADTSLSTTPMLSVYGALLLRGAVATARAGDRGRAHALLNEADAAARHVGVDGNACWTAFGPTNVVIHRVAVAVELGDAGTAIHLAGTVNLDSLAVSERKAMLFLDAARALLQLDQFEKSFIAMRTAAHHAPDEVHARPLARRILTELRQRSPGRIQQQVHAWITTPRNDP